MLTRLAAVSVVLVVAGCATSGEDGTLSQAELSAALVGQTLQFQSGEVTGSMMLNRDGSARLWNSSIPGLQSDEGTWRFSRGQLCNTWSVMREGEETCVSVTRTGSNTFTTSAGTILRVT